MRVPVGARSLPLTRGLVALVDIEDYARVSVHKWNAHRRIYPNREPVYYATRTDWNGADPKLVYLHRVILNAPEGVHVDHVKPSRTLDCRKCNLRLATRSQNLGNQRKRVCATSSRFKGVQWHKAAGKWMARIMVRSHPQYLGLFRSEVQAATAYNRAARKYFGEFARVNKIGVQG